MKYLGKLNDSAFIDFAIKTRKEYFEVSGNESTDNKE
jgi:hypothetical protein